MASVRRVLQSVGPALLVVSAFLPWWYSSMLPGGERTRLGIEGLAGWVAVVLAGGLTYSAFRHERWVPYASLGGAVVAAVLYFVGPGGSAFPRLGWDVTWGYYVLFFVASPWLLLYGTVGLLVGVVQRARRRG